MMNFTYSTPYSSALIRDLRPPSTCKSVLLVTLNWGALAFLMTYVSLPGRLDAAENEPIVLGYYPGYEGFALENLPWSKLTHVCHAFLTSDPQGRIQVGEKVPSRRLTEAGRDHGVPVILSIGGWGDADGFEQATSTPQKMKRWVDDITEIVVENDYAGVDVDWEFPRDESTKRRFTKLLGAIRQEFDSIEKQSGGHLLITSAVTARPQQGKWIDGPAIEPYLDFINVMTYDFSGPWEKVAAHHAPLEPSASDPEKSWRSVRQAMQYWEQTQGFPKSKLNVGIPLYGRKFPLRDPYGKLADLPKSDFGTPEYKAIAKLVDSGWNRLLDPDCQVPWLKAPTGQEGLIAYDDEQSVKIKGQWARENGYRGIFFWAIGHDYLEDGKHHLIDAAVEGWREEQ